LGMGANGSVYLCQVCFSNILYVWSHYLNAFSQHVLDGNPLGTPHSICLFPHDLGLWQFSRTFRSKEDRSRRISFLFTSHPSRSKTPWEASASKHYNLPVSEPHFFLHRQ
jgi:hypothetical protein